MRGRRSISLLKLLAIIGMMLLYCAPSAVAQLDTLYIAEDPQLAQGEIIASRDENRDANGRLAAGLFISTDLTGLTFQANNGVIKRVDRPGEYRLYLSPDERRVMVYKEGFTPFSMVLSQIGVRLSSGQAWTLTISGSKEIPDLPASFIFTPSSVQPELRIDGAVVDQYEGVPLAVGEHVVQIQANNFDSITDTITVAEDAANLFRYELERVAPQLITITTNPSGADITLGGEALGRTPLERHFKSPGQYMLEVSRDGFLPVEEQIEIQRTETPTQVQTFNITLPKNTATIILDVTPEDATVTFNGSEVDYSSPLDYPGGDLLMEVMADGFQTYTESFNAARGDTVWKTVELEEIFGSLQFTVKPLDAEVTLRRGREIVDTWSGPNYIADLRTGSYVVEASHNEYIIERETFEITEGQLEELALEMQPRDGFGTISVQGIPGDAKVTVSGPNGSASGDLLPFNASSLRFGPYIVTVKKKGFKTVRDQITLNEPSESINLTNQFQAKSKGTAVGMMLLIPGGGQFYMGKTGRGLLYLAASGAAVGYTVMSLGTVQTEIDNYKAALQSYERATSNFDSQWAQVQSSFQAKEDAKGDVEMGIMAFIGVRALEFIDNLLTKTPKPEQSRVNFETGGNSVSLRVNF